jgi:hypothetical protein
MDDYKERADETRNALYRYLLDHKSQVHKFARSDLDDVGFISDGKVLNKIAEFPYASRSTDFINACLYEGNIYLRAFNLEPINDQVYPYGYIMRKLFLSKYPDTLPDPKKPILESELFKGVYTMEIDQHRLMYSTRINSIVVENGKNDRISDVEDKTVEEIVEELRTKKFADLHTSLKKEKTFTFR